MIAMTTLESIEITLFESLITEKWFFETLALILTFFAKLKTFKLSLQKNDLGKLHKKNE